MNEMTNEPVLFRKRCRRGQFLTLPVEWLRLAPCLATRFSGAGHTLDLFHTTPLDLLASSIPTCASLGALLATAHPNLSALPVSYSFAYSEALVLVHAATSLWEGCRLCWYRLYAGKKPLAFSCGCFSFDRAVLRLDAFSVVGAAQLPGWPFDVRGLSSPTRIPHVHPEI